MTTSSWRLSWPFKKTWRPGSFWKTNTSSCYCKDCLPSSLVDNVCWSPLTGSLWACRLEGSSRISPKVPGNMASAPLPWLRLNSAVSIRLDPSCLWHDWPVVRLFDPMIVLARIPISHGLEVSLEGDRRRHNHRVRSFPRRRSCSSPSLASAHVALNFLPALRDNQSLSPSKPLGTGGRSAVEPEAPKSIAAIILGEKTELMLTFLLFHELQSHCNSSRAFRQLVANVESFLYPFPKRSNRRHAKQTTARHGT